jgi:uncharacterized protein (TIGR02147 family)
MLTKVPRSYKFQILQGDNVLSIYKYSEPHTFLKDAWVSKKTKNTAFSMRAWAKRLGFENNAPLSLMLAGKRPIPKKYLPKIASDLELSANESLYLDILVDFANAKSGEEKDFYFKRLKSIAPEPPIVQIELEHFKFLGDPIHTCILEMIELKKFIPDATAIQKQLRFPATLQRIEGAINRLVVLGLVRQTADGGLIKQVRHVTNKPDVVDLGTQEYHKNVSTLAADVVSEQSVDEKEFNSYTLNIRKSSLPKAKQKIRTFIQEFIKEIEAEPFTAEDTYQFNVQLFGMARLNVQSNK